VDGTVRLWEENQSAESTSYGHSQPVRCLALSPQGTRLASGSDNGQIILWDPQTGDDVTKCAGHLGGITSLAFSHDGKFLLAGDQRHDIKLWDAATGKELAGVTAGGTPAKVGFLDKDRAIVAWTGNAEVFLWPFANQPVPSVKADSMQSFIGTDQHPNALSIAGNRIFLGTIDGNTKVWRVSADLKGESPQTIPCFNEAIYGQTVNFAGSRLLSLNPDSQLKWIDVEKKQPLQTWKGRPARPMCFAVHPDRDLALVGFESNEVVLWNPATGQELRTWKFRGPITDLVIAPNGKQAFAAAQNAVIYRLDLP
jgi:WD40 repeat protein